jgi:imidazolonepropionase-like amidohydrolase
MSKLRRAPRRFFAGLVSLLLLGASCLTHAAPTSGILPPGFRPVPPGVHALVGARVVVKPGEVLTNATIIIRDGFIEAVAANAAVPADARVWDMKGLTVYAGFIDPYLTLGPKSDEKSSDKEDERNLTAGGIKFFGVHPQESESGPVVGPDYEVAALKPERRVADKFQPDPKALEEMRELGFTAANVTPQEGIMRGTSAFVALSDAEPGRAIIKPDVFQHVSFSLVRRKMDVYPESLMGVVAAVRQAVFDAQYYIRDQEDYAKHPKDRTRPDYNAGLEALRPAVEKKMPVVFAPEDALMVDRVTRVAHELGLDYYIVSSGQEWRRPDLAKAANVPFIVPVNFPELPKLPDEDDWQQVTLDELRSWDWALENPALLRKQGMDIALTTHGLEDKKSFRKNLRLAMGRGLSENDALAALTTIPARLCGLDKSLGTVEPGKMANLTVVDGKGYFDEHAKVNSVWIDGRFYRIAPEEEKEKGEGKKETAKAEKEKKKKEKADKEKKFAREKELAKRVARSPLEGRGVLADPPAVLIRHATIWTCGSAGVLTNADLLVENGKIKAVGADLKTDVSKTLKIDGTGLHVTPGIIDCHSHSMILGDVNESTLPSSAMVRIGDVVNSETEHIYEQLAGGVTAVNLLHGSANPIGGQNQVIKLRDGEPPEELKYVNAPPGIKFALGENVKQSNWGDKYTSRFPQSRMGVKTFFENRFTAAQEYLKAIADAKKNGTLPPRRDLELEALGEIIEGKRLIHCHSYRQDEMLMLLRTMPEFGVTPGSFQHGLEGYKIADEIAKAGVGVSTFADWWAYKFEVYDAIPYNGSLMHDRGVVVSFNSDSGDLARRLYLEAAKAVKFGNTPEIEALKFVTLNPAIQLHIDKYVGSLEPGKDADFAIWSQAPLDSRTVCQQTWIDGKKYFDIKLAPARAAALAKEREELIARAKKLEKMTSSDGGGDDGKGADDNAFFKKSLEHEYDGRVRHCLDNENE